MGISFGIEPTGVFSDVDIRRALKRGSVSIDHFDESLLSPDSYDITVGDVWEVIDERLKDSILDLQKRLGSRGPATDYHLPEISPRKMTRSERTGKLKRHPRNRLLIRNHVYVGENTTGIHTDEKIKAVIVPTSGKARDGIFAFNPNINGESMVAIVPSTMAKVPETSIAQTLFLYAGTKPLTLQEMILFWNREKLHFPDATKFYEDGKGIGYAAMHYQRKLKPYKGGELTEVGSEDRFLEGAKSNGTFDFYLGITAERFGTSNSFILWMFSPDGHLYRNAPLCHANVKPQYHTLEVTLTKDEARKITAGEKAVYACSIMTYPLHSPASRRYSGTYNGQTEPLPKRLAQLIPV